MHGLVATYTCSLSSVVITKIKWVCVACICTLNLILPLRACLERGLDWVRISPPCPDMAWPTEASSPGTVMHGPSLFSSHVGLYVPSVCRWFLNYYYLFWPPILSGLLNIVPWMSNWNFKLTRCKTTSLTYPTPNLFLPQHSPFQKSGPPSVCYSHGSHSWFPIFFTPYLLIHQPILLVLLKFFPHLPTFLPLSCSLLHFH